MRLDSQKIADDLCAKSWSLQREVLSLEEARTLHSYFDQLQNQGHFRIAGVGADRQTIESTRQDQICWIDPHESALSFVCTPLEALREGLNQELFLNAAYFEAHWAIYPPGGHYSRHLDQLKNSTARALSFILYLNQGWSASRDGGQLRIYEGGGHSTDIDPECGNFLCFLSDKIEHEVLPTRRERRTLTGWMRRHV